MMMTKTVLAVDDERSIVRLIQVNLERAGYLVETAYDGKQALEMIAQKKPDMVISDVMMPYLDGFELLRHLRKDVETRELPVIMLTAKAQDSNLTEGWKSGASMYLTKPFNPKELLMWVKRIFESEELAGDTRYDL